MRLLVLVCPNLWFLLPGKKKLELEILNAFVCFGLP